MRAYCVVKEEALVNHVSAMSKREVVGIVQIQAKTWKANDDCNRRKTSIDPLIRIILQEFFSAACCACNGLAMPQRHWGTFYTRGILGQVLVWSQKSWYRHALWGDTMIHGQTRPSGCQIQRARGVSEGGHLFGTQCWWKRAHGAPELRGIVRAECMQSTRLVRRFTFTRRCHEALAPMRNVLCIVQELI
jgi:hypothetical protein